MNRRFKFYALIWLILFAAFNIVCFAVPSEMAGMSKYGGAFWSGYIFIDISFIGQLICAYIALKPDDKTKLFYNIPMIRISYTGLVITMAVDVLCMAIPQLPNFIGMIAGILILAFTAVSVITAKAASDIAESIDDRIKADTQFIRTITAEAKSLMPYAKTDAVKEACKKVYEAFRYSDPVTDGRLEDIEMQIKDRYERFAEEVKMGNKAETGNSDTISEMADGIVVMINERNTKCKMMKGR